MDASGETDAQPDKPTDQDMLRQFLADRDVACPACRYNIRQLQTSTCPECGRDLFLTVGAVGLSNTWIAALVGALVPAGCGFPIVVLLLIALSQGAPLSELTSEPEGIIFLLLVFYALCCVVFSILLIVMRGGFMRLPPKAQSGIAAALLMAGAFAA